MPTTTVLDGDGTDWTAGVSALGARTDNAGAAVTDWAQDEARLINHLLTEGFLTSGAFVVSDGASGMQVDVGSGTAKADIYVVEGDDAGQHPYLVRMDDTTVTVTLDAGDADARTDEIWLVVRDATYDGGSLTEAQLAVRKGDAGGGAPGPDGAWDAAVLLASIAVGVSASTVGAGDITDDRTASTLNAVVEAALDHGSISGLGDGDHDHGTLSGLADFTADHGTEHDSHDHSAAASTIAAADLADHNKTVHDALNIDADTLDEVQLADLMGSLEVDGSVEVASVALGGTVADVATVSLTIPSDWDGYKIVTESSYVLRANSSGGADVNFDVVVSIGGTAQQTQEALIAAAGENGLQVPGACGGRRTGMTATGSVDVKLRASGDNSMTDIYLYARAVRTS